MKDKNKTPLKHTPMSTVMKTLTARLFLYVFMIINKPYKPQNQSTPRTQ